MIEISILTQDLINYEIALQISWSQICEDIRPSCEYIYKATQLWSCYQCESCVRSYEEIKFKGDIESKLISGN